MKVLAINASARRDGNTAILIRSVFEALDREGIETEMIQLAGQTISPAKRAGRAVGAKTASIKRTLFMKSLRR